MFNKYSLEIISHHQNFKNKSMRQYNVDGINTVGVFGDEPFEVVFKNHTGATVQVKLSLDGTDLLTGEKADTNVSREMWVVNGYGTLNIKAWPETQNGGAALIFTSINNSVAVHTHGDLSSRSIIAAAVFEEGHVEPARVTQEKHYHYDYHYDYFYPYKVIPIWYYNFSDYSFSSNTYTVFTNNGGGGTISTNNIGSSLPTLGSCDVSANKKEQSYAAVGAGDYINQQITYTKGLIKPLFTETVRVRYLWWDDLKVKLNEQQVSQPHGSGFPGDKSRGINLGNTPRIGSNKTTFNINASQPAYHRF